MALLAALRGWQSGMWTALPAIVQSFDATKKTCVVQIAVQMLQTLQTTSGTNAGIDVSKKWINVAPIHDVPVHFPSGGGYTLTFPVAAGDECLVVFSSRCIDSWWQNGGFSNPQSILRMHDLSDGFAFVGISSVPNVQSNISTASVQLRSNDGTTYVDLHNNNISLNATNANSNVTVNATNTGSSIVLNAPTVTVNSTNATVNATAKATVVAPEIDMTASTKIVATTPEMDLTGNLVIGGLITVNGAGTSTMAGSLSTTSGDITAGGKSLKTHTHNVAGVQTGTSTVTSNGPN